MEEGGGINSLLRSHSAIIHFPIALFITSFIFGIIGLFFNRTLFKELIFWNVIFGLIACGVAIYTGLLEMRAIQDPLLRASLVDHQRNAFFICGILLVMVVWMGFRRASMEVMEYIAWMSVYFIAATGVAYQGIMGHDMKKKHTERIIEMRTKAIEKPKTEDYGWQY